MYSRILGLAFLASIFFSCKQESPVSRGTWHYTSSYPLENVFPISITGDASHLYVSSGLKTEIFKYNYDGGLVLQIKNIRKPKYLNILSTGVVVVAESEAHVATRVEGQDYISTIPTNEFLNTPFGVSVEGNSIAITDYTDHKVYFNQRGYVLTFGEPGIGDRQFDGPSDIQIKNGRIYIADSKNNRVQVFDTLAKFKQTIGENEKMNTVGGLYVSNEEIAVTDYVGNRLLIFDLKGKLKQTFTESFDRPSDVFIRGKEMFVVNYGGNSISVFSKW